ncbi:hypothetical protein [Polyangium spumosum]|uniref:Tetratricopeptide repeat protein n=1 Tax=Polyangium spumosum TaxID=889282 RepID=A0A6N7PWZ2_9BACT|nr:hypothetical protein [Polyangium spumosum]MRG93331.1 hypothetical protein [Polyangium spumosum]
MTARPRLQRALPGGLRFGRDRRGPRASGRASFVPRAIAPAIVLVLLSVCRSARADDMQQFELGKTRFDAAEYDEAASRFAAMLDPAQEPCEPEATSGAAPCRLTDADLIQRARTLLAASLVALKRYDEAEAEIATILRQNPTYAPDPAVLPQEVVDRFTLVRARLREELDAAAQKRAEEDRQRRIAEQKAKEEEKRWVESLVKAASERQVIVQNSRLVAAMPFGIGQFQNGNKKLGWTFAITQAFTGASSIAASQVFNYYASFDQTIATGAERAELVRRQQITLVINQVAFGLWAGLTVAGIVQAQIAFVPQKVTIEKRPLPPRPALRVVPTVAVTPDGFSVGAIGAF